MLAAKVDGETSPKTNLEGDIPSDSAKKSLAETSSAKKSSSAERPSAKKAAGRATAERAAVKFYAES